MEDGGPERRDGEPCPQAGDSGGAGPGNLLLLLLTARPTLPGPGDGAARGEPAETGSSSLGGLARSLQKAEAMLRNCVSPSLRRLLSPRPRERGYGSEDEDEEEEETPALLALLEQSFSGLRRCLCVWEDPRTETFRGRVRPQPGDSTTTATPAFSYHPVHPCVAERGAALHALLQHRHHLRLARDYSRRLKAASDFLRRLLALVERPELLVGELGAAQPLRELCQELRTHAGHWSGLRRRMSSDPWLRPLLLRRHESVAHMRQALLLLALHAVRLAERHAEAWLRGLARAAPATAPSSALLSDLFQGLEIYNHVVGDLALELGIAGCLPAGITGCHRATGDGSHAFPVARVLGILAAERGRLVAERLQPLLQPWDGGGRAEHVCWEDATVPWPLECGATVVVDAGPSRQEELPGLAGELWALCREDEELMGQILGVLVASADSLWHHVLHGPKQEKLAAAVESPKLPAASLGTATRPSSAGWKTVRWLDASRAPAAEALHAQYRQLFWGAAGTALGHCLGWPHCGAGRAMAATQELSHALTQAGVPRECKEELGWLCLRLLCRAVLQSWERDFACALGSGLSDKCLGEPVPAAGPVWSRTAQCLQRLYPALAFALRCLQPLPTRPPGHLPGSPCLRLQVLGCCLATSQAACSWLMGRACRYLAAWALPQFLLITQGDLQLLKMETDRLVVLVTGTFLEPGDAPPQPPPAALSPQELQLCQQICSMAASIQLFSGDVLKMFSTNCKRMSAAIFDQTMPLGKHWRVGFRADLPSSPSAYAAAAAHAVLGQVLQGAQLLPHDAQAPALARVTTAFLEAWMDHILAQRIKFSLQGALQLRQDFELVRELVASERYGLAPETRQSLLSLRVFQQMDGAILCLLQQPGGVAGMPPRPWHSLRRCCLDNGAHPPEPTSGNLHSLDTLEAATAAPGPPPLAPSAEPLARLQSSVPESYLTGSQQQWLSLRLHRARRWRVPGLPCVGNNPEV
ncbi:LOW QUALITY PROTEIN: coiled-coil domain-containing protein 142 [Falco rusticolus]|uniref:LOW QUALITY PROTEIN: coiled-coil domain-containing protein 142 n=1 Tax=Falco rusticolus TaxID=120794 RepID=UPI0018865F71|nr:LOW QUALITY PROTEIN: coiled-coil domain-containing protein 142 [Falco rusticolus]